MLDIKYIRENSDQIKENCKNRGAVVDIDKLLEFDKEIREIKTDLQSLQSERNKKSKSKPTEEDIVKMKKVGESIKELEEKVNTLNKEYLPLLMAIPNLTHKDVKISTDEDDNPVLETIGKKTDFSFKAKDHVELAKELDLIDFDRATEVSGPKFYYLKNELALLEMALIQYTMSIAMKYGYTPMTTPDVAKTAIQEALGFNPRGESTQIYNIENTDLSLIGTAEITLGGYHANETIKEEDLPKKYIATSHCFRTEAGSYSKFSKGIFRVHQFTKVEMFTYNVPEQNEEIHQEMLNIEKEIFKGLKIPFRIIDHCTADLGNPSIRTYDLEAWLPGKPNKEEGRGDWGEVTSASICTDYQSRALNIKYKKEDGKKELVHTLNGTGIAIPRAIIAIMENHQKKDGTITIPKVLKPFMHGIKKIKKEK